MMASRVISFGLMPLLIIFSNFIWNTFQSSNGEFSTTYFTNWLFAVFLGDFTGVKSLLNMPVPNFDLELFIGNGQLVDENRVNLNYSGNDSGYIQHLSCMGLIPSVIMYFLLFYHIYINTHKKIPVIGWTFLPICMILESKEPFLFKYNLLIFVSLFIYMFKNSAKLSTKMRVI